MLEITIPYLLERAAGKYPNKDAVAADHGRLTYSQWRRNSDRMALAFQKMGLKHGDHVATLFLNDVTLLEVYFALLRLGAVLVPLNVRLSAAELSYIVNDSDASILIYAHQFRPLVDKMRSQTPGITQYVVSGGEPLEGESSLEGLVQNAQGDLQPPELKQTDTVCILYTAGTTGKPKGVVLSHYNCIWAAASAAAEVDLIPDYKVALVFPLFHSAAFAILVTNLYLGCTSVTMAKFDPALVMDRVQEEGVNRLVLPPTAWNFILQMPQLDKYDTTSVRSLGSGAETLPVHTKQRLLEVFPNAKLGETYGMTETMATISTLKPADVLRKTASVGKPYYNVEVRIVDDQGEDLAPGQVGEILVRGPNVTSGYYHNPQATQEAFKDAWLCTGDLGEFDEEGFLYIRDRKKDMIISGGENIYPKEIEEVLVTHPKVLDVAVVGAPDEVWGEMVQAVVVLKPGETCRESEIIEYCQDRLASFKKPKSVKFVDALPRSSAGKILKRVLRENLGAVS